MDTVTKSLCGALAVSLSANAAQLVVGSVTTEAQQKTVAVVIPEQDPDVLAALPEHAGKWLGCVTASADIDPGTPSARKSSMRCDWSVDDRIEPQWLTPDEEEAARGKIRLP